MNIDQLNHYKTKLAFETDSWDLYEAMTRNEPVVVIDGRSAEAYARGCNASTRTALKLLTLGFQVRELMGGLDWWKRDGYATEGEACQVGTEVNCGC